jgi:transcription-repair coupling factor (superfamily II helicase)
MSALDLQFLQESEPFQQLLREVRAGRRVIRVTGLVAGANALLLAALQRTIGQPLAIVTRRNRDLETLEPDLRFFHRHWGGEDRDAEAVYSLPAPESDPYSGTSPHAELLERRALGLWRLSEGKGDLILLTARSLLFRLIAPEELRRLVVRLRVGEEVPPEELVRHLIAIGYVRSDPVGSVGEFSSRGGIVDLFSPGLTEKTTGRPLGPLRIEFFGDTIESIREFDPDTQRSVGEIEEAQIVPMREERASREGLKEWAERARQTWQEDRYDRALRDRTILADEGEEFPGWEYLLPLVRPLTASIFDYLRHALVVIDEPSEMEQEIRTIYEDLDRGYTRCESIDELGLLPEKLVLTTQELQHVCHSLPRIELRMLGGDGLVVDSELSLEGLLNRGAPLTRQVEPATLETGAARFPQVIDRVPPAPLFLFPREEAAAEIPMASRAVRRWHGRLGELITDLKRRSSSGERTVFLLPTTGVAERLRKVLLEYQALGAGEIVVGDLSVGFALPRIPITFYSEADLFDEPVAPKRTEKARRSQAGAFLSDFRDLKVGDYVVHIDHGIGQFQGLLQLDTGETESSAEIYARLTGQASEQTTRPRREFMLLTFAEGTKLYVPVERLDLVQKYSSAESHIPTLDRLGGIAWQKTKARAKRAMRDMAEELLKLYAERKLVSGFAFSGDSPWQEEFEASFPHELTPDQATAIADTKRDMEQPTPMDRLLCGDVGYGKTEVAMRAAFKAVMEGKQVAVLAPTTVLAYQHYQTFTSRFAAFPVTIDLLSRFRPLKEQKEVVAQLAAGKIDILIGTHRILSRDLSFRELALVIVDEEQRFGVAHKERLKQLKRRVDVLTMSATPIPRTLNMSLLGLRDMSVIETPPRDRLAIQTNVIPFSEPIIRSAIEQELQRQGQVFFIHNRVETIEEIAGLLKRIVPEARFIVAHGQMEERAMEQAVLDFVEYRYDVLVATTIVENGIDIPRANTILINRADRYGLSQLYQLRGRVGRSNRRSYAYLLIPSERELTPIARRRLAAIREFSDLGAGFRIAALDLELRGAGNLLGGQQSGHIEAIGFDLYTQMLERTIHELRGEEIEDEISTQINLGIETRIPEDYIGDMGQRLRTYKRIASARSDAEMARIREEIGDRYGRLPEAVTNLLAYARLRRLAEKLGVVSIDRHQHRLSLKLGERAKVDPERLMRYLTTHPEAQFSPSGVLKTALAAGEGRPSADSIFATLFGVLESWLPSDEAHRSA